MNDLIRSIVCIVMSLIAFVSTDVIPYNEDIYVDAIEVLALKVEDTKKVLFECQEKPVGDINVSDFATEYVILEKELINKVKKKEADNVLIFTATTDAHCNYTNDYMRSFLDVSYVGARIAEEIGADFRVDLGDIFSDVDDTKENACIMNEYITYCKNSSVPFVYTQGNHETFGGHHDENNKLITALTQSQVSEIGLTGTDLNAVRNSAELMGGYFYFDFPDKKVRIYCLNSKNNSFSDASVLWVDRTLVSMPKDYGVVFLSHIPPINEALWDGHPETYNAVELREVMGKYVKNGGKIFALFHGHMHWDNLFYASDLQCPVIGIASSIIDQSEINNPPASGKATKPERSQSDVTRYVIENVCINTETGEISLIRFGAGQDRIYIPESCFND